MILKYIVPHLKVHIYKEDWNEIQLKEFMHFLFSFYNEDVLFS